jgi:hypothetical protein
MHGMEGTGVPVTAVSIITRRLKEGKTYGDFRKAWFHSTGFGIAGSDGTGKNTMYSMVNIFDPREIIVIGFSTATPDAMEEALKVEVKFRGENPLDDVIEPSVGRTFALLVAEDDFGAAGTIPFTPAAVGEKQTNMAEFEKSLQDIASLFAAAAKKRDAINKERKHERT